MAEFKKLSDVEVVETPTDTANVLIEEDGVIKKTPKTAVGGDGGPDAVITSSGYGYPYELEYKNNYVLPENFYQHIHEVAATGKMPEIIIYLANQEEDGHMTYNFRHCDDIEVGEFISFTFFKHNNVRVTAMVDSDNIVYNVAITSLTVE
jgi:hypothetical protein